MDWKNWSEWILLRCARDAGGARRVLEIGGSGGELGSWLEGREFHTLNSPRGDICRPTKFPSGYFDLILSKMSFEHFYDPVAAADEITRLLAPGGTMIALTVWAWRHHTAPGVEDYFRFSTEGVRQLFYRLEEVECGYDLTDRRVDCRQDNVAVDDMGGWREHWYVYFTARKPDIRQTAAPAALWRPPARWLRSTMDEVRSTYEPLFEDPDLAPVVAAVLRVREQDVAANLFADGERGLPSEPRFFSTGYHRMMLGRYLFAGSQFCRGMDVLDSCSGLGWGSFLTAHYAARVTAFDIDAEVVAFCERAWPAENIRWVCGDALSPRFLDTECFDVVLAMETVEHFEEIDAERYVSLVEQRLKTGGVFIGTSTFPQTREEAREIAARNPHHPHIFTAGEFQDLLRRHFSRAAIVGGWMFIAFK